MDLGLSLEKQIELHESEVLRIEKLCIMNNSPSTIDNQLCGKMISISFPCDYNKTFTKKMFPGGVYMFDIGKIQYVVPGSKHNDGLRELIVLYESGPFSVKIDLGYYASDSVTIPTKEHQWRLLG